MANVLVIGSGGREHALVWKLRKSDYVQNLYCAPGNGGTALNATNVPITINGSDFGGIDNLVREKKIDLTVVGPEVHLVNGIVDYYKDNGLIDEEHFIFGPTKSAARLEGSKAFAKDFMFRHSIPTAGFKILYDSDAAKAYLRSQEMPIVIKASGLASGKGSIVCKTLEEADNSIERIMIKKEFKDSGDEVVIEEFMEGQEASILALTDGNEIRVLASSQDHKQIYDGDEGPNTGGMGAYAPAPIATDEIMAKVHERILLPTINGMKEENNPFTGCLYVGLMIKDKEPRVVEFNARFGDPEAQPVLSLLENDLYLLLKSCVKGTLGTHQIRNKKGAACCVVMVSGGYPGKYEEGKEIFGLEDAANIENVYVFHAGTKKEGGKILTNGGRVLGVTGVGKNIEDSIKIAYSGVEKIRWEKEYHRTDIGAKALNRK
ncbi:phosphoribosylamine--glycine ligase [Candidatus Woesearchaeota archaeon]|nr:phosphoribosylamine--glycine ligase [Candidatus Woesearchaeota archaeon]